MKKLILSLWIILMLSMLAAGSADSLFLAADQSLLIMPTAYTMPKGQSALTDFEIILLQYSYAATDRIHLTAATAFPITEELLRTFSVGSKINYLKKGKLQSAAWTSYTPDVKILTLGNVCSYGNPRGSIHCAGAFVSTFKEKQGSALAALGGIKNFSTRTAGIAELIFIAQNDINNASEMVNTNYINTLVLGIRFKGNRMSWDLGAIRPLNEDMGDLIALPYLKATFMF